jgi:prepilin-type N-terminal cleavage/methylation domain-containing protein
MAGQRIRDDGFTVLELVVVLVLVVMAMSLTLPRFRDYLVSDPLETAAAGICAALRGARAEAYGLQRFYGLELDLDGGGYRLPAVKEGVKNDPRPLPDGVTIRSVWIKEAGGIFGGKAKIEYTPKGFTRPALIHLGYRDGREITVEVSPFLGAFIHEGRLDMGNDG